MKIRDLTLTISPELAVWPGDPPIDLHRVSKIEDGEICNITRMDISVHTGTHVDAPYHFLSSGTTVETLSLETLTGEASVIHLPGVKSITKKDLESAQIPKNTHRLLIRTDNSDLWASSQSSFHEHYVAVQKDAANWLVENGISLIGVDYLSVAPFTDVTPTHTILLEAGVVIVEGLNLADVLPGRYLFYCLPLKIAGSDGAPARAILIDEE